MTHANTLRREQDDLADQGVELRERTRRAWILATRAEEIARETPRFVRRPSLFDEPIVLAERIRGVCDFPGCGRRRHYNNGLCPSHARQKTRRGLLHLTPLLPPIAVKQDRCKRGHDDWKTEKDGDRRCMTCQREGARRRGRR